MSTCCVQFAPMTDLNVILQTMHWEILRTMHCLKMYYILRPMHFNKSINSVITQSPSYLGVGLLNSNQKFLLKPG